jgi:hypothetical protein
LPLFMQGFLRTTMELTFTHSTKYYIVKWHYFWNAAQNGKVAILKVDTLHQGVDYLRKDLLVKPLNGSARLIKDGKQQTSRMVSCWICCSVLLGCCYLSFLKKRMIKRES